MTNQSLFAGRFLVVTIAAAVVLAVPGLVAHAGQLNAVSGHSGHSGFAIAQAAGNSGGYPPLGFNPGNSNQTNQPNGATWRSAPPPETMPLGPYAPIPQKHKAATGPDNKTAGGTAGGTNAFEGSGAATPATPMQAAPSTNDAQMNLPPPGYPLPGMTQPMPPAAAPAGTAGASAQDAPTAQQQMQYPNIQQPQYQYSGKPQTHGAPQVQAQPQQGQQWSQQAPGTAAGAPSAAPRQAPEQQQPAGYAQDGRQPQGSPQQGQQLNQQAYPPWSVPQYQQYKYWGQQWGQQPASATAPSNAAQQQQGQPAQQPAQWQPQYVQPPPAYRPSMTPQQTAPVQQQTAPTQRQAAPTTGIAVSPPGQAAAQPAKPAQPYPPAGQAARYPEVQPQTHNWRGSQRPDYQPGANPHWWGGVR